ncbi:RluA family pseudouridine synthase [Ignavigranum ruoffiae]|uniref:RluA family pseudouridine synthase n=1 Tax=Ignavigranum ruoffiae TaxID=89093 RepID=UPI00206EAA58|nr:RluA family pseudouridine synthase [Ignavigranum ruoffiae]UPQ85572.1 RluA family pseudouridine synthase [Ignavigranum ruoffiae]
MDCQDIYLKGQKGRLDKVLAELIPGQSRSSIQKLIQQEYIQVNGQVVPNKYLLAGNEHIRYSIPEEEALELVAEDLPLDIRYEDQDLLVVNKARGMVVHPAKGHDRGTLVNGLLYYLQGNISLKQGSSIRPGIVHRIDKDTSGLLIIAKNNQVHRLLADQLQAHQIQRTYHAIVYGQVQPLQATIDIPLKRDKVQRLRYTADKTGKRAITHYKVLKTFSEYSLVQCQLETGRTHQIRVHMEYIHHPLLGDPIYQRDLNPQHFPIRDLQDGQYLHAKSLRFRHPLTDKVIEIDTEYPEYFQTMLNQITEINREL